MTSRRLTTIASLFLGLASLLAGPVPLPAQDARNASALTPFTGTWKGICADGAEFIVLKLSQSGDEMAGTVSIANMSGPKGQCGSVIDPPADEHAMKIHNVQLQGKELSFKGSGQAAFQMSVAGDEASLKLLGTPVENKPWKLSRVKSAAK